MRHFALTLLTICGMGVNLAPAQAADSIASDADRMLEQSFEQQAKPFLKQYCLRCHNAEKASSGVRVDQLDASLEDRHLRLWKAMRKQIADEAMPPEDEPQPSDVERQRMVQWIEHALSVARSRPRPKNGLVRRLTVAQYRNTLRELLQFEDDLTEALRPMRSRETAS